MTDTLRIDYTTSTGTDCVILLHKPYPSSANGNLSFSNSNFSFRSGNYASYIDEINDETIALSGYENTAAMQKFVELGEVADEGYEITITSLNGEYVGVYIINSISYTPIGLDVFEYSISLKFVREFVPSVTTTLCLPMCWNLYGHIGWSI